MKKSLYIVVLGMASLLWGCGKDGVDGVDGKASIAYGWSGQWTALSSSDPAIPTSVTNYYYYPAQTGTWSFSYTAWDGSRWNSSYTIYKNAGTKGTVGTLVGDGDNGKDGEDVYFLLNLYGAGVGGPEFSVWNYEKKATFGGSGKLTAGSSPEALEQQAVNESSTLSAGSRTDTMISGTRTIEGVSGSYHYKFQTRRVE